MIIQLAVTNEELTPWNASAQTCKKLASKCSSSGWCMSIAGLQRPCVIQIRSAVHRFLCGWTYLCRSTSKALSSGLSQQWCRFSFREEGSTFHTCGGPTFSLSEWLGKVYRSPGRFLSVSTISTFQGDYICSLCHIYPVVLANAIYNWIPCY